jgi:hypothetical protein
MSRNHSGNDGTPFSRIFGAVLLALIVYGLLQAAVTALLARAALDEVNRQVKAITDAPTPASVAMPRRMQRVHRPRYCGGWAWYARTAI